MDQDTVVGLPIVSGERLISALAAEGFEIRVAFWARPTEAGKWLLYMSSPVVDKDATLAYRRIHELLRRMPDVDIELFEIRLLQTNDSLTEAALALESNKQKSWASRQLGQNPRPYTRMVRFDGGTLAGVSMDGAYIYPLPGLGAPA